MSQDLPEIEKQFQRDYHILPMGRFGIVEKEQKYLEIRGKGSPLRIHLAREDPRGGLVGLTQEELILKFNGVPIKIVHGMPNPGNLGNNPDLQIAERNSELRERTERLMATVLDEYEFISSAPIEAKMKPTGDYDVHLRSQDGSPVLLHTRNQTPRGILKTFQEDYMIVTVGGISVYLYHNLAGTKPR